MDESSLNKTSEPNFYRAVCRWVEVFGKVKLVTIVERRYVLCCRHRLTIGIM